MEGGFSMWGDLSFISVDTLMDMDLHDHVGLGRLEYERRRI